MKRLQPIGNSVGVIIDKALLDLMKADRDTTVEFEVLDADRLILKFVRKPRRQRVDEAIERTMTRHAGTMRKLAK